MGGCGGGRWERSGPPFPTSGLRGGSVPTFLMFLLQDNLDCRAACPLWPEVARDEVQRRAEASGGWGAQDPLSPIVPCTRILGMSLQTAGRMKITDRPLPAEEQQDRAAVRPAGRHSMTS